MPEATQWFKSNDDRVPRGCARFGVTDWDRKRGNHRAVVRVNEKTDAVCAYLPWRRRDAHPEAKHIMVVAAQTDEVVPNVVVASCNKEYGEILFQPVSGPGDYYLYYLVPGEDPYGEVWPRSSFPIILYKRPQNHPEEAWLEKHGLTTDALESTTAPGRWARPGREVYPAAWRELPLAELVEFQCRGERHSFYPMEVIATLDEQSELEHACRFQPFILFPELRNNPIRMTDALPCCWATRDEAALSTLSDTAMRNEYYVFQVGVYASKKLLRDVAVSFTDLTTDDGAVLSADAITCFNLEGVDQYGEDFTRTVHVEYQKVQALWFGLDIPDDATPGAYSGEVTISAEDEDPQTISLSLTVEDKILADRGDGDHWRLSRLRWLNSRIAIDDNVCAPFTPIEVKGNTIEILGRHVELTEEGMLGQMTSFIDMFDLTEEGQPVLREPATLEIVVDGETIPLSGSLQSEHSSPGVARFKSQVGGDQLTVEVWTTVEMDGFIGHRVSIQSEAPIDIDSVRVALPFTGEASRYHMYLADMTIDQVSHKSDFGATPDDQWSYALESFELLWLGSYNAGLCLRIPPGQTSWINEGVGSITRMPGEDGHTVLLDSGAMTVDGLVEFEVELYATPFKPLSRDGWNMRHYHQSYCKDPVIKKGQDAGATVFTYHQGNRVSPYISYPFLCADEFAEAAEEIHAGGGLMKAYYTIRELSDRATELWMLRSLGNEVLSASDARPGYPDYHLGYKELSQLPIEYQLRTQVAWPYTGYPWQCEHLVDDYHSRWHTTVDMGDRTIIDGSLQISGASRWSNFYMEGMKWLMENAGLDGIYLDGITFDRESFKRVRKTLVRTKAEGLIDYHSAPTAIAQMPYFDRLWFGEGANYSREPDYWLVAVSGIPFGVGGELLGAPSEQRGMVFGISNRYAWSSLDRVDPSHLWRWWDEFEIDKAEMLGFWQDACPVKPGHDDIRATAYVHRGRSTAIAVASWAEEDVSVALDIDWETLGLDPSEVTVTVPAIEMFQEQLATPDLDALEIAPNKGWLVVIENAAAPEG